MSLWQILQSNRVAIVMSVSLGLIHWGWYNLKSSSLLQSTKQEHIPEPGIVSYVLNQSADPPAAPKSK